MEAFRASVRERTGLVLSLSEAIKLYSLYLDERTRKVDIDQLCADLLKPVASASTSAAQLDGASPVILSGDELVQMLHDRVQLKLDSAKVRDQTKRIYWLLSESRSPCVTKPQLKKSCQLRLDIALKDVEVDALFDYLGAGKGESLKIRDLVNAVMKKGKRHNVSLSVGKDEEPPRTPKLYGSEAARISYDEKYLNLVPPDPANCRLHTVWELENIIRDKITEQSSLACNKAKTARKLFSSGGHISGDLKISMDQLRFTFWTRFRVDVSDTDLQRFFQKHQRVGAIPLSSIMQALFREAEANSTAINMDDHTLNTPERTEVAIKINQNNSLDSFFTALRQQINNLVNAEGRAPHYLLHGTSRMTFEQAKLYFRRKLRFDLDQFSPDLILQVLRAYTHNGLVDMKKVFLEAMAIKSAPDPTSESDDAMMHQPLLNGAIVAVTKPPVALQYVRQTPEDIEAALCAKCQERLQSSTQPHAYLHKIFSDPDSDSRTISRRAMHKVLRTFDILLDQRDFDAFFAKHDRGDGHIDVPLLLRRLLPAVDLNENPFLPKSPSTVRVEQHIAQALKSVTGHQREVGNLNGGTTGRLHPDLLRPKTAVHASPPGEEFSDDVSQNSHKSLEHLLEHLRNRRLQHSDASGTYRAATSSPLTAVGSAMSPRPPSSARGSASRCKSPRKGGAPVDEDGDARQIDGIGPAAHSVSSPTPAVLAQQTSPSSGSHHFGHFPPSALRPASATGRMAWGTRINRVEAAAERKAAQKQHQVPELQVHGFGVDVLQTSNSRPATSRADGSMQQVMQDLLNNALKDLGLGVEGRSRSPSPQSPMMVRPASATQSSRPHSAAAGSPRPLPSNSMPHAVDGGSVASYHAQQSALLRHLADAYDALGSQAAADEHKHHRPRSASPRPEASFVPILEIAADGKTQTLPSFARPVSAPPAATRPRAIAPAQPLPAADTAPPSTPTQGPPTDRPASAKVQVHIPTLSGISEGARPLKGSFLADKTPKKQHFQHYNASPAYKLDTTAEAAVGGTSSPVAPSPPESTPSSARTHRTQYTKANGTVSQVQGSAASPQYVYTGQRRQMRTDPDGVILNYQYKISKKHIATTQGEYGFFAKSIARQAKQNARLYNKQHAHTTRKGV